MSKPAPATGTVLVTGATGTVGRELVAQLLEAGESVRALVRDPTSAALPADVEVVTGDLADPDTFRGDLDGITAVFLVWPFTAPETATALAPKVLETLAARGRRIVYLSATAAAAAPDSFWAVVERQVRQSASWWTLLRPTGFAKNTLMWADQIRTDGVVRWPFPDAARSLIDERDIAAVALLALTQLGHRGETYVLTGPQTLTHVEQVRAIGDALGHRLRFQELSRSEARPMLVAAFGDEAFVDSSLDVWEGFAAQPEEVTSTVQDLTGRPAGTLRDWAGRHVADFR